MFRRFILVATALLGACSPQDKAPAISPPRRITVADSGLNTPESVVYDAAGDRYLVANINGSPLEKDGNGFISRVSTDGNITEARWIAGGTNGVTLNAPKGMGVKGDTLFVADIDVVRMFNRETGAPIGTRTVPGATMLNDVAVGADGTVYFTDSGLKAGPNGFTDSGTDAVYRFDDKSKAVAIAKNKNLGRPNGVTADGDAVIVATFGTGEVYRLDVKSGARTDLPKPPKGQLDGVEKIADGSVLVSSWEGSAVYRLTDTTWTTAVDSVPSPADFGWDSKRTAVVIPIFTGNRIEIREVK